jgi:hypothetical protein
MEGKMAEIQDQLKRATSAAHVSAILDSMERDASSVVLDDNARTWLGRLLSPLPGPVPVQACRLAPGSASGMSHSDALVGVLLREHEQQFDESFVADILALQRLRGQLNESAIDLNADNKGRVVRILRQLRLYFLEESPMPSRPRPRGF